MARLLPILLALLLGACASTPIAFDGAATLSSNETIAPSRTLRITADERSGLA